MVDLGWGHHVKATGPLSKTPTAAVLVTKTHQDINMNASHCVLMLDHI